MLPAAVGHWISGLFCVVWVMGYVLFVIWHGLRVKGSCVICYGLCVRGYVLYVMGYGLCGTGYVLPVTCYVWCDMG